MRIYTRGGDRGKTSLIGGQRREKHDVRVQAYGSIDEAGAFIGLAMSYLHPERDQDILDVLADVQQRLWDVGADLAAPPGAQYTPRTPDDAANHIEPLIDGFKAEADTIKTFVMRGGTSGAAALHVACTVVRRAERTMVALMAEEETSSASLKYINRLSDLLFVLARAVNARDHRPETAYEAGGQVFRD